MALCAVFVALFLFVPPAWQRHLDDVTYGYPRTYQTDAAVGQQAPHSEITLDVAPDGQEAPAPRPPRRLSSLLVVATGVLCLALLLAHLLLPAFLASPADRAPASGR